METSCSRIEDDSNKHVKFYESQVLSLRIGEKRVTWSFLLEILGFHIDFFTELLSRIDLESPMREQYYKFGASA